MIKKILIILAVVLGAGICFYIYKICTTERIVIVEKEIIKKIDSLENTNTVLQEKKDSVTERIDTVVSKIKDNKTKHEEIANTVVHNDMSADYEFFSEYIESNRQRLDSLYNL